MFTLEMTHLEELNFTGDTVKYFEPLTDGLFKRANDHWEFFPYTIGVGFKITSEARYRALRYRLNRYLLRSTALIVTVTAVVGWPVAVALAPALLLLYLGCVGDLTAGLSRSEKNLSLAESLRLQAASSKMWILWYLQITSLFFTGLGIALLIFGSQHWYMGLLPTVFFGAGSATTMYILHTKKRLACGAKVRPTLHPFPGNVLPQPSKA